MLTPPSVLVLFIVSVLGLAWSFFTLLFYAKSRHSGKFVALVDLLFVGAFIAGVYFLRDIAGADCSNFSNGNFYLSLGVFGYVGSQTNSQWAADLNKNCAMLKAAFAFGIMNCIFFFITFVSPCSCILRECLLTVYSFLLSLSHATTKRMTSRRRS